MKLNLPGLPFLPDDASDEMKALYDWLFQFQGIVGENIDGAALGFGDGVVTDNISGMWYRYTTNAVANVEDAIPHNLGVVPIGWLTITCDKAGVLYTGGSTWTNSLMYLKCSVAAMTVLIFVLAPSNRPH